MNIDHPGQYNVHQEKQEITLEGSQNATKVNNVAVNSVPVCFSREHVLKTNFEGQI